MVNETLEQDELRSNHHPHRHPVRTAARSDAVRTRDLPTLGRRREIPHERGITSCRSAYGMTVRRRFRFKPSCSKDWIAGSSPAMTARPVRVRAGQRA